MAIIIEKDLCYEIVGCCYDVRNKYGMYHKEKVYDRALSEQLASKNIKIKNQPRINVYSLDTGNISATYIPDKLTEDKVTLEVKAQQFVPTNEQKRAIEYLRTSKYEI